MGIYILAIALFTMLIVSLMELDRLGELHHGYYGAIIVGVAYFTHMPLWVPIVGTIFIFDDTFQHLYEAFGFRQRMADFTPIHKAGAWLMGINWKALGWKAPIAIVIVLAAAAIFCATYFGV